MGISILFLSFTSCSKEEIEAGEWDNWQSRNEAYFTSLADSLRAAPNQWKRIKCYSLNSETEGKADDYIYVKVLEQGTESESPAFTDSVRVIYQGYAVRVLERLPGGRRFGLGIFRQAHPQEIPVPLL